MAIYSKLGFDPIVVDMVAYLSERGEDVSALTVRPSYVILEIDHEPRDEDRCDYVAFVAREVVFVGFKTMSLAEAVEYLDERHPAPGGRSWSAWFSFASIAALERDSKPLLMPVAA